jgi:hypothetical protein
MALITSLMATVVHQRSAMRAQQLISEMHQNVRYAMDTICRDVRAAGYGLDVSDAVLDEWVGWVMNFTSNPMVVQGTGDEPDKLLIAAAFDEPVTTLAAAAAKGANTITVADATMFNTFDRRLIYIGRTSTARITAIDGNILTISTRPSASGGLRHDFGAGSPVELVKLVRYECNDAADYPDYPYLARTDTSEYYAQNWMKVSAGHIEDLQVVQNGNAFEVSVTGVVAHPDRFYTHPTEADHLRRETLTSSIAPRN